MAFSHLKKISFFQIRVLEIHNVDFVSGSRRTPEGKWHMNCFQSQYKNYSLQIGKNHALKNLTSLL